MTKPVVTLGVDLSAKDSKTWTAAIVWSDGRAGKGQAGTQGGRQPNRPGGTGCLDDRDRLPFGWPAPFVKYVSDHTGGGVDDQGSDGDTWRKALANRTTDGWVKCKTKLNPLSVSADRIGHVAFRCAHLLSQIVRPEVEVDRAGITGHVVEVYPAALKVWVYLEKSCKGRDGRPVLHAMAERFLNDYDWLVLGDDDRGLRLTNDDAFDSLVAGLVARAQAATLVETLDADQIAIGIMEGWIALPIPGSLKTLAL